MQECDENNTYRTNTDEDEAEPHSDRAADLPQHATMNEPNFTWGDIDGKSFIQSIEQAYSEIIHWRRNLFKVPSGKAGKSFTTEIAKLFRAFADKTALESIALRAAMSLPALVLQKPHLNSRAKEHTVHLDRRMKLWHKGDINALLHECRTIQQKFYQLKNRKRTEDKLARTFEKMMMEGRVSAALRLISADENRGCLPLDEEVRQSFQTKHPHAQPPQPSAIITPENNVPKPHSILFDRINAQLIRKTALRTNGAAGPSGLDAMAWRQICTSFQTASADLCEALASTARRLCVENVHPDGVSAFVSSRLIALDKNPGVRPIGIGETSRRIIGKAILTTISEDIQDAAGPLQLCAGQDAGCEAAVHAMRQLFQSPDAEAVLLVDATNAFNSLNRQTALRNIQHLCPSLATVLINTCRKETPLFIDGETLYSQEGTTQGDPLAMAMYAIAITPLISQLSSNEVTQAWFADDATAGGDLSKLRRWWDHLARVGPDYGYFPNAAKTWLIVGEDKLEQATNIFHGTDIAITTNGRRHLGAALGTKSFVEEYVTQKVSEWTTEIEHLSSIAISKPHAAYAAFTHGAISKWTYLARTIPDIGDLLKPLENSIRQKFLPAITGQVALNDSERELVALPVCHGGLGITDPSKQTAFQHECSLKITKPLTALNPTTVINMPT